MKKCFTNLNLFLLVLPLFTVSINSSDAQQTSTLKSAGLAPVNGIQMYYELHEEANR